MAMLEVLLLMAAQAPTPPPTKAAPPPIELLEFLGDWAEEDARLIDAERVPAEKPTDPKPRPGARDTGGRTP